MKNWQILLISAQIWAVPHVQLSVAAPIVVGLLALAFFEKVLPK